MTVTHVSPPDPTLDMPVSLSGQYLPNRHANSVTPKRYRGVVALTPHGRPAALPLGRCARAAQEDLTPGIVFLTLEDPLLLIRRLNIGPVRTPNSRLQPCCSPRPQPRAGRWHQAPCIFGSIGVLTSTRGRWRSTRILRTSPCSVSLEATWSSLRSSLRSRSRPDRHPFRRRRRKGGTGRRRSGELGEPAAGVLGAAVLDVQ